MSLPVKEISPLAKTSDACDLNTCFLCTSCITDWKLAIAGNKINYGIKKGQQIFREGDPVKGIYFVYKGKVKVHKKWDTEKELILRFAKTGDILGHLGLGDTEKYPISATAIEPCVICYIDMGFLNSTLNINNGFVIKLMRFFANELMESEKRMRNLAHMPVKGRVAQAFITLKKQFGINSAGFINIELTRQELASFTGVAYESLFRTINDMITDNMIEVAGKDICIKNEGKLHRLISENNINLGD